MGHSPLPLAFKLSGAPVNVTGAPNKARGRKAQPASELRPRVFGQSPAGPDETGGKAHPPKTKEYTLEIPRCAPGPGFLSNQCRLRLAERKPRSPFEGRRKLTAAASTHITGAHKKTQSTTLTYLFHIHMLTARAHRNVFHIFLHTCPSLFIYSIASSIYLHVSLRSS